MIKTYIIPYLLLIIIFFSSCSKTLLIHQGEHGYAGELGDNYEITQLDQVSSESKTWFGFGTGKINRDGLVTNFFGSNVNHKQSSFLKMLTYLVYSSIVPTIVSQNNEEYVIEASHIIGGLAFGGILNNLTWINTPVNEAVRQGTQKLIDNNPTVDLFVYPKYKITTKPGLFSSKASFTINSKGASLKK